MVRCRVFLAATALTTFALTLSAQTKLALVPAPREYTESGAPLSLAKGVAVVCNGCDAQDQFAAQDLTQGLTQEGVSVSQSGAVQVTLLRASTAAGRQALADAHIAWTPAMDAEGYVIVPAKNGLAVVGASASGVFYGAQTVKQLVDAVALHSVVIRDWPALKVRGLSDDLSRGPFPTVEFMQKQIRTLAAYKVNFYTPYFENNFQYLSQPLIGNPGGVLTQGEARQLIAYAAQYHIMVVPEQEAFGHVHGVLNWEQYASLSETPHGQVMAPGQAGSLELSKAMFGELANVFPAPYLHLGADETFELGKGQTKTDVDARGLGAVYLDYLQKLVTALKPLDRKLLFWGDIAMHDPELLKNLPTEFKQSVIAMPWEYNPQPKGFGPFIKPFTDAGIECWVSPGVNSWSRVYPNNNMALANIQQFTAEGQAAGCTGQVNTIWNDDGEGLMNSDWYGVLFGAAAAWEQGAASIPNFQSAYGRVFHGDATGKINEAQKELMAAHALLKDNFKQSDGSDLLFWLDPWSADGQRYAPMLRPYLSQLRMHSERAIVLVREARAAGNLRETDALDALELGARRMDLIGFKFQVSDEMAVAYANATKLSTGTAKTDRADAGRQLGVINSTNGKLQDLRDAYSLTRDLYEQAWLKSYRPYWLHNNLARYDITIQMWMGRIDKVRAGQRMWQTQQKLPSASDLGIPAPAPAQP